MNLQSNLDNLNTAQQQAVLRVDGPCMIIAGAGTGKTSVVAHRIAFLLSQGVDASSILAMTFTNKAAKEMKARVFSILNSSVISNIWLGTFHSVFLKILKFHSNLIGYSFNFSLYDTDDSKAVIKSIIKEINVDPDLYSLSVVLSRISEAKNNLVGVDYYTNKYLEKDLIFKRPAINEIYLRYVRRCKESDAMDFDDLLYNTYLLFKGNAEVLSNYQRIFKYIMVDEFQDTNLLQYMILKMLAGEYKNLCVIGDDAQSIYSFRGARIENMLNFSNDFPDLVVSKLEQNYRSTQNIVDLANCIISKNSCQIEKKSWTQNVQGERVQLIKCESDFFEALMVIDKISAIKKKAKASYNQIAVLYRANSQSRIIEESLQRAQIPYKLVGGISFYKRKEIKDFFAYLKLVVNPNDSQAFLRVINFPKRGIGVSSLEKLSIFAAEASISLWQACLQGGLDLLPKGVKLAISEFIEMISKFSSICHTANPVDLVENIVSTVGLLNLFDQDSRFETEARRENIQQAISAINDFYKINPQASIADFLQEISLFTSVEEDISDQSVTLMTIHAAKGLEFDYVFIVGINEGVFPSKMSVIAQEDIQEERRLFYVAVTRARKELFLSCTKRSFRFGKEIEVQPSRFFNEIEKESEILNTNCFFDKKNFKIFQQLHKFEKEAKSRNNIFMSTKPNNNMINQIDNEVVEMRAGMQVVHPKFNFGVVVSVDHSSIFPKIIVNFKNYGEKTLLLKFAALKVVSQQ